MVCTPLKQHADKLVRYHERGTHLLVHRFDTSSSEPELLECNCYAHYGVQHKSQARSLTQVQKSMDLPQQPVYSYPQVVVTPGPVIPSYSWTQPVNPLQGLNEGFQPPTVGQFTYQPGYYPALADPAFSQQQYVSGPAYDQNSYGLPVNVSNGPVPSESREVHISNIQYQVRKRDIATHISKIAIPTSLDYHVDYSGKFKGTAVANFSSGEDAARVVAQLDKKLIKGKKVKVRLGKQLTPVTPPPLVLNGSYEARFL
jgi:hypothetical protein